MNYPSYISYLWCICFLLCLNTRLSAQSVEGIVFLKNGTQKNIELSPDYRLQTVRLESKHSKVSIPFDQIDRLEAESKVFIPKQVEYYLNLSDARFKNKIDFSTRDTTVLLEKELGGKINFYTYIDAAGNPHFFIEKDTMINELAQLTIDRNEGKAKLVDRYFGILKIYVHDCPEIKIHKKQHKFRYHSIYKVVKKYNTTCGGDLSFKAKRAKYKIGLGIIGGYYSFQSDYEIGPPLTIVDQLSTQGEVADAKPIFGGFVEFPLSRIKRNLKIVFDATFYNSVNFAYQTETMGSPAFGDTIRRAAAFEASYFQTGFSVQYAIDIEKSEIDPVFSVGVGGFHLMKVTTDWREDVRARRPFWYQYEKSYDVISRSTKGTKLTILLRAGLKYKRFKLLGMYRFGRGGITNNPEESNQTVGIELRANLF